MSQVNTGSENDAKRAPSPTPSERSMRSDVSTASSRIPKASGIKPPSATIKKPSTSVESSAPSPATPRIGRLCTQHGHGMKLGPPPLELQKSETDSTTQIKMRRQSDEFSRSHLPDVYEESEADLQSERNNNDIYRSTKSRSPDYSYERKGSKGDRRSSNGSTNSDWYIEATGRRRSSDQGVVLTTDTDQFIIGQRVYVGGHRPGQIAFIGETNFAPGEWAGIVLDDASGKNDGCVSGKRYFQCEPKRGIFSKLTRLTMEPLGEFASSPTNSMSTSMRSFASPPRSGTVSPTRSVSSYIGKSPAKSGLSIGDRVIVSSGMGSRAGILQYIGETKFAPGNWCGVQLDEPTGKNDGTVDGLQYFVCPPNYGIFVPLAKVSLSPLARKSRLSRAGSKESLTSFGTIGSITSTNTSRLRMSAQRLSSAAKPPASTPKNTFSLQDLLREKQNHVEQLILERDLTRQQTENDTMMFQKNINQLRDKVTALEKQLLEELQKSEDLQFSIDEATICGDDQSTKTEKSPSSVAQAEYRDRIALLEKEVLDARSKAASSAEIIQQTEEATKLREELSQKTGEIASLSDQLERLQSNCDALKRSKEELEQNSEIKISSLGVSENCLREEIDYLKRQIDELKTELVRKDEVNEKEFISLKNIEHEMKEELASLRTELKAKEIALEANQTDYKAQIAEKQAEIVQCKQTVEQFEQQLANLAIEKEAAISSEKSAFSQANDQNAKAQNELAESHQAVEQHLATIQELQKTLNEKLAQSEQLTNDAIAMQANLEATKQNVTEKAATIAELESLATDRQQNITDLQEKLNKSDDEAQLFRDTVSEKDQHIKKLSQDISELTERIGEIAAAKTLFEQESNDRANELVAHAEKMTLLEKEVENERKNATEYRTQIEAINQSANKSEADYARDMAEKLNEIEHLRESCAASQTECENVRKQYQQASNELQQARSEIGSSTDQITALNETLREMETSKLNDNSTIDSLNGEVKKHMAHIDELAKTNADVKTKNIELQRTLDESIDQNDMKERNLKDSKHRIDQLQSQLNQSHGDIGKNKTAFDELNTKLQSLHGEHTAKMQQLSQLEIDFADLQRKQTLTEEKCEQLTKEKASLQQNFDAVQSSSSDANSELHRLMEEIKGKQKSYDDLVDSSNAHKLELEKRLHECQQSLDQRTAQSEQLSSELESFTTHKIDRENELNLELATIKEANEMQAEALKNEIDALKQTFKQDKEKILAEHQSTVAQFETAVNEHRSTIDNLENTMKNVQLELTKARKDITQKNEELGSAANRYSQLESKLNEQIDHTRLAEENVRSTGKSLNEKLAAKDKEIQNISTELEAQKKQVAELEGNLKAKQAEIDSVGGAKSDLETQLTVKITALTNENDKLKSECDGLTKVKSELDEKYQKLAETFRDTEDEQVDLVDRNLELQKQVNGLTESLKQIDVLKEEIKQKDANFNQISEERQSLQKQLDEVNETAITKNAATAEQIALLEKQLTVAKETFDQFESDVERAKIETDKAIQSLTKESLEKDAVIKSLEEKVSQLAPSVNLSDDLKNELKDKSEELRLKESNITELMSKVAELQQQCTDKDAHLEKVTDEYHTISKLSTDDMQARTTELEEAVKRAELAQKTIADQSQQITDALEQRASVENENTELKAKIAGLTENTSQQGTEVTKLQEQLSLLEEQKKTEIDQMTLKLWDNEEKIKDQAESIEKLMQMQSSDEETTRALKTREAELLLSNKKLEGEIITLKVNLKEKERMLAAEVKVTATEAAESAKSNEFVAEGEPGAQISFLNSIIADMQRKNEALKAQIHSAELFKNPIFDVPIKRKPAPRLFCDICDLFDAHDTEECPVQSSGDSPMHTATTTNNGEEQQPKKRVIPPPRKYCEACEVFGHEEGECDVDETY